MDIAIGLPTTIPGIDGRSLIAWARRADEAGFSSLGTIDRIVYPNYEPLISLAAAAAVTERIGLTTTVLLGPLRANTPLLAKELATLDSLSGGRLVLGIGLGARGDDYETSGLSTKGRGVRLDAQIEELKRIWAQGEAGIGPPPGREGGPPILIGGGADAAFRRAARFGDGWIMAAGPPDYYRAMAAKVDEAWAAEGRADKPRKAAQAYFSLGANARETAYSYMTDYYGWLGDFAEQIAAGAAIGEDAVQRYVQDFEAAGCEEVFFMPCSTDVEQVELLAKAALTRD